MTFPTRCDKDNVSGYLHAVRELSTFIMTAIVFVGYKCDGSCSRPNSRPSRACALKIIARCRYLSVQPRLPTQACREQVLFSKATYLKPCNSPPSIFQHRIIHGLVCFGAFRISIHCLLRNKACPAVSLLCLQRAPIFGTCVSHSRLCDARLITWLNPFVYSGSFFGHLGNSY